LYYLNGFILFLSFFLFSPSFLPFFLHLIPWSFNVTIYTFSLSRYELQIHFFHFFQMPTSHPWASQETIHLFLPLIFECPFIRYWSCDVFGLLLYFFCYLSVHTESNSTFNIIQTQWTGKYRNYT
jgi:hypothetical protein